LNCSQQGASNKSIDWPESSSPDSEASIQDNEIFKAKRGHVLAELMDTERIYVSEMASILKVIHNDSFNLVFDNFLLKGYHNELLKAEKEGRAPITLHKKSDVIFGNLEDLHRFHKDIFLMDLENCITTPDLVGLCFVQRVS